MALQTELDSLKKVCIIINCYFIEFYIALLNNLNYLFILGILKIKKCL